MKAKLLDLIEAGRQKEAEGLLPHVDDSAPTRSGQWTVKDTVANLMSWRRIAIAQLDSVRTGREAPIVADENIDQNAGFHAQAGLTPARVFYQTPSKCW